MRVIVNFVCLVVSAATLSSQHGFAGIVYSGGTYDQNFNGLTQSGSQILSGRGPHSFSDVTGVSGMSGWYLANPSGTSTNTEYRAQNGSLAGGAGRGVVSFGTDGSSDRALGALPTSNQISSFGAVFVNNTGATLTSVSISYFGEQWRKGGVGVTNQLSFFYGLGTSIDDANVSVSSLDFATIQTGGEAAIDGNDDANRQLISGMITGLNWANGDSFVVRWNMNEVSGQDTGLAIDDFRFSAVPEPSALLLVGSVLGFGALRRRRA